MPGIRITLGQNDDINQALRRLKRIREREGFMREMKKHRFYEKPSERRRRRILKTERDRRKRQAETEPSSHR